MSSVTTIQAHIAYELIDCTNQHVVVIDFLTDDITSPVRARELGEQLDSLIQRHWVRYFVIDFANVRSLGSTAFGEIVSFVRKATRVWVCNLDDGLRLGASLVGLDDCARFVASRRVAIGEALGTPRLDEDDTADYP
jgi:anti-anti-sigma regulatory factor